MDDNERARLDRIKPNLKRRAQIIQEVRTFFIHHGYLEIETPIRVSALAPESEIIPFQSEGWFLITSPELSMKRLLAAGYDCIFQISHCFRKGEVGRLHNPEFSLLEWYRVGADYMDMMKDTEQMVLEVTKAIHEKTVIRYKNSNIDISLPWERITVSDAFNKYAGWDPADSNDLSSFDDDLVGKIIPGFAVNHPTILSDYPAKLASLSKIKSNNHKVAERAEVFIGGLEIANAFTELIDAEEQKQRFMNEMAKINARGLVKMPMPDKFLEAVSLMKPCGGIALGLDRLVMLLCDAGSLDEVMPFPVDNA
jgi:elongation factor P--(R)-beta-lysine ligase